ncbi:hypothetical protein HMPREF0058_1453 [Actinomyces urogenitalis DSM 15434]|uniref:Uncharacterized protein n=1 Tax=Actinomyces urogenitalis DSM 15434 TaxID=525246 RepID=C0W6F9_9ACTO|nr:hypothetical protein HMPREF0058_1453 [Actinomyces urogenitalis DSM 15434]
MVGNRRAARMCASAVPSHSPRYASAPTTHLTMVVSLDSVA